MTMKLPIFLVDAFTSKPFSGNPAAVCPLDFWLDDETMQKIATENNLSETAFIVNRGDYYQIRWFTATSCAGSLRRWKSTCAVTPPWPVPG